MAGYETKDIRNIVLVGHGASGKTSLIESLLFKAGATTRLGSVDDGTSVVDYEPDEKERTFTINSKILHCKWLDKELNVVDTPGYPDFIGEAISALTAVETVLVVIAATSGIQTNTRRLWKLATEKGLGRIIVITKMDGENIEFLQLLESIKKNFGAACTPLTVPVGCGHDFKDVVSALEPDAKTPDGAIGDVNHFREALMEAIVEADDALLQRYLEGEEIENEKIQQCLIKAIAGGNVVPILCCSNKKDIGIKEVLDAIANYAASPEEHAGRKCLDAEKGEEIVLDNSAAAPFCAQVFKCITDPFVGKLAFFRTFSGALDGDLSFYNPRTKKNEKPGHILKVFGKDQTAVHKVIVGDILAMSKVEDVNISDALCSPKRPVKFNPITFPIPMVSLAVEPKTKGAEQKISTALQKLAEEDHTFKVNRDTQTGELVISGMTNLHLDIMIGRLKRRFEVEVNAKPPKIPYKETITAKAESKYKHKKQTGGRGQYGEVYIRMEPLQRGAGFEFANEIFGGSIPNQYIPPIEKGIRESMAKGILAGCSIVDVKVTIYDGSFHTVDSSEAAFKIASSKAFHIAFKDANPVLLEPIVNIEVTIPSEFMGEISGNLISRRGRIAGMDSAGEFQVIKASIPMSEIMRYETELKSMTGGQGSYTIEFSHYDAVPSHIAQTIIAETQKEKEEEK
ncbi:MAG: elongation factor G [Candidatus Brocadiales bacterium]